MTTTDEEGMSIPKFKKSVMLAAFKRSDVEEISNKCFVLLFRVLNNYAMRLVKRSMRLALVSSVENPVHLYVL